LMATLQPVPSPCSNARKSGETLGPYAKDGDGSGGTAKAYVLDKLLSVVTGEEARAAIADDVLRDLTTPTTTGRRHAVWLNP
jgi:hypothetical protein